MTARRVAALAVGVLTLMTTTAPTGDATAPKPIMLVDPARAHTVRVFRTVLVDVFVWVDAALRVGEWLSLATLSTDASDQWSRVVTLNLGPDGRLGLFHVPQQGEGRPQRPNLDKTLPMRRWVHLRMEADLSPHGAVRVWQDGRFITESRVEGGGGRLEQAHFGIYASPSVARATVYNDDVTIRAIRGSRPAVQAARRNG